MKRTGIALVVALVMAACSGSSVASTETTAGGTDTTPQASTSSAATDLIPPQLTDHEVRDVQVGDRVLTLAIADSPTLREQGLMGVTDLGSLDGMLFYWRHDAFGDGFWMKDTLIPLDVVFFLEDGTYVGRVSMTPCPPEESDCPTYNPGEGVDYRLAIEANPGDLDWIDGSTVIHYED